MNRTRLSFCRPALSPAIAAILLVSGLVACATETVPEAIEQTESPAPQEPAAVSEEDVEPPPPAPDPSSGVAALDPSLQIFALDADTLSWLEEMDELVTERVRGFAEALLQQRNEDASTVQLFAERATQDEGDVFEGNAILATGDQRGGGSHVAVNFNSGRSPEGLALPSPLSPEFASSATVDSTRTGEYTQVNWWDLDPGWSIAVVFGQDHSRQESARWSPEVGFSYSSLDPNTGSTQVLSVASREEGAALIGPLLQLAGELSSLEA